MVLESLQAQDFQRHLGWAVLLNSHGALEAPLWRRFLNDALERNPWLGGASGNSGELAGRPLREKTLSADNSHGLNSDDEMTHQTSVMVDMLNSRLHQSRHTVGTVADF